MRNFSFYKKRDIYCTFAGAIILQFMYSYITMWWFKPSCSMISLVYWVILSPKQVSIGTGFFLGLITDCVFGSILGIHALSFSIISYIIIRRLYLVRNVSILQQSVFIVFFSVIDQSLRLLVIFLITNNFISTEIYWNCILNGIVWPLLLFLIRKIHVQ